MGGPTARTTVEDMSEREPEEHDGQVSEVGNLDRADEEIADDQSVAGSPDPDVDEGPTGPNSRAGSDRN